MGSAVSFVSLITSKNIEYLELGKEGAVECLPKQSFVLSSGTFWSFFTFSSRYQLSVTMTSPLLQVLERAIRLFICFTVRVFRGLSSICVCAFFLKGDGAVQGKIWDLIVIPGPEVIKLVSC